MPPKFALFLQTTSEDLHLKQSKLYLSPNTIQAAAETTTTPIPRHQNHINQTIIAAAMPPSTRQRRVAQLRSIEAKNHLAISLGVAPAPPALPTQHSPPTNFANALLVQMQENPPKTTVI
jgi:hypothetical protein